MKQNITMTKIMVTDRKKYMEKDVFDRLREAISKSGYSQIQIARAAGIQQGSLSRFLKGTQATLSGEALTKLFDFLGADIIFPHEQPHDASKDVCFVNAKLVPAAEGMAPPQAVDYIAAPMVGEAGAGPGYLPEEEVKSWFLVYRYQAAVRYRRNLIAVEIGPHSTSMQPVLNPGDIVLIDRDDRDVSSPGHMMLVLDPLDGSGMVKRVAVTDLPDGDLRITYYSDNAAQNPPSVYSLRRDFGGDIDRSIVGRVVWAWSDVKEK